MTGLRLTRRGEAVVAALAATTAAVALVLGLALPLVLPWTGVGAWELVTR